MSTYELGTNEKKYGLAHFDAAYRALAEAVRIEDLVPIEKWATLALAYAKEAHDREKELLAARLRLHAQRKAGHTLTVTAGNGERAARGGNGSNQHEQMSPAVTFAPTLADLGISRNESSKWQKLAAIPETDFEATMADSLDNHGTVTTAEVLRAHALRDKWRNDLRDTLEAVEVKEAKALAGRYDVIDI